MYIRLSTKVLRVLEQHFITEGRETLSRSKLNSRLISLPEYVWITATHLFYIVANDSDVRAFTSQEKEHLELVCAACVVHAISLNRLEVEMQKIAAQLRNLSRNLSLSGAH